MQQLDSAGNPQPVYVGKWGPDKLDFQGIGYVAAHVKWRITRVEHGIGLALGLQVGSGLSSAASNAAGDDGFFYWPSAIVEKRFGSRGEFRVALNGGYRGHTPASTTTMPLKDGNYADGDLFTYGGGLSWRVLEPLDLVAETYGTYLLASNADSNVKLSNEAVGGIKLFVERNSYLMLGGGARYTTGFEAADIRALHRLHLRAVDRRPRRRRATRTTSTSAPTSRRTSTASRTKTAAPIRTTTTTASSTSTIAASTMPEDRDGDQDDDGCPEGHDGDRDGDGILDSNDKCPDDPEDRDGFQDTDGCPDPDNDKDGIPDKTDAARTTPRTRTASRTRTAARIRTTTTTASPT